MGRVRYTAGGVTFTREVFASHPAGVIVVRLTASQPGQLSGTLRLSDVRPNQPTAAGDTVSFSGALPNGLRYALQHNETPKDGVSMRLRIGAGSLQERDGEEGLAHFLEHMAFNGTTHFPGGEIPAFIQRLGMRFGAHVNAHTGFDETVYQLQIPTDNRGIIDRSLLILEDWATGVTFDPKEVEKERGVKDLGLIAKFCEAVRRADG